MAIPKSTSVKALARIRAEREEFDRREREARRDAAIELGEAVLKSADLALELVRDYLRRGRLGGLGGSG